MITAPDEYPLWKTRTLVTLPVSSAQPIEYAYAIVSGVSYPACDNG